MKYLLFIFLLSPLFYLGYVVNANNYAFNKNIELQYINHPEFLPESKSVEIASFGFTNTVADFYWLSSIQYIGENAIGGEYKRYLGSMLDLITDLSPYFESPYVIGQLLLPSNEMDRDEDFTEEEIAQNIEYGRQLGHKGVENFCNLEIIENIDRENDLGKIISDETGQFSNPCTSYKVPFYLAFIYYFYLDDPINAAKYYKVVSAQKEAPEGARVLAAIMQGKGGEREKSVFMLLSLAKSLGNNNEACSVLSNEIEQVYIGFASNNIDLPSSLIRDIENLANEVLPDLTEENENEVFDDTQCSNFLAKAVRELNLIYISEANERYYSETGENARNAKLLFDEGYIDFLPTDYQQYPDEGYGIVYRFNEDIGRFDYDMGSY